MNKGNFIFCLSFKMTLSTLCSVMRYSFLLQFVTVHNRTRQWERRENEKENECVWERGKVEKASKIEKKEAKRILFHSFSHHNRHSRVPLLALDLDKWNMCLRGWIVKLRETILQSLELVEMAVRGRAVTTTKHRKKKAIKVSMKCSSSSSLPSLWLSLLFEWFHVGNQHATIIIAYIEADGNRETFCVILDGPRCLSEYNRHTFHVRLHIFCFEWFLLSCRFI